MHAPSPESSSMEEPAWKPDRRFWLILAGQTVSAWIVSLDSTILTVSLPTVAQALDANAVTAYWFITSYLLATAVVQPLTAALADVFGRRSTFFTSILIFTLGTIICATAHGATQMLVGRVVQGVGGGGIFSINLIILSDLIPLRQRSTYVGIVQLFASFAINLGPVIGGALIKVTWRWLFYINFPFCGIALAAIPFLLRYVSAETTFYHKLSSIDWIGCGIFMVGATAFLLGISWGGNEYAWSSAATLVPLIVGAAIVAFSIFYESRLTRKPFLRLSIFRNRTSVAAYLCTILASLTLFAEAYFVSLFLLTSRQYSPIVAACVFMALAFAVVPVSGITGALITKINGYRWAVFSGWLINTFGVGSLMVLGPDSYLPGMCFVLILAGTGQGMLFIAHQVAAQAGCKAKDAAYATAMFSFCRNLGYCLGVALGGTIFQNFLRHRLAHYGLPTDIAADAEGFAPVLKHMADDAIKQATILAFTEAFHYLWATMAGISGLGFALSFLIREHTLDVKHDSTHKLRSSDMLADAPAAEREKAALMSA